MSTTPTPDAKTPLYALHCELGGKLVRFAGTALPLFYSGGGQLAEHLHTRAAASLFDVSHMGQVQLPPLAASAAALERLTPAALGDIAPGQAKYTVLLNEQGGVIDDCIITNDGADGWFIVLNAARKTADIAALKEALAAAGAAESSDGLTEYARGLLAVQGPAAAQVVGAVFAAAAGLRFMQSVCTEADWGDGRAQCRLSRCGYSGEDGFEIAVPAAQTDSLARKLLADARCKPAGLGARDSLRLEAGLCLYGNELDESITPIEAGLLWTIPKARRRADAGYNGAAVIAQQINAASGAAGGEAGAAARPRRLAGLLPQGKMPVRAAAELFYNGAPCGRVTSGVYSPTLAAPIALALLHGDVPPQAEVVANVRGREVVCRPQALPFVPHRYCK